MKFIKLTSNNIEKASREVYVNMELVQTLAAYESGGSVLMFTDQPDFSDQLFVKETPEEILLLAAGLYYDH